MFAKQSQGVIVAIASSVLIFGARAEAAERFAPDPCKLLTPAQINAVTGLAFAAGTPIIAGKSCQWISPSPKHGITTVDFFPADSWSKMKAQWASVSQAVSGVGDDAFYFNVGTYGAFAIKKGDAVFTLKVYGIPQEKQMAILKTLANDAIANL